MTFKTLQNNEIQPFCYLLTINIIPSGLQRLMERIWTLGQYFAKASTQFIEGCCYYDCPLSELQ